jgi:RNase P protein component
MGRKDRNEKPLSLRDTIREFRRELHGDIAKTFDEVFCASSGCKGLSFKEALVNGESLQKAFVSAKKVVQPMINAHKMVQPKKED